MACSGASRVSKVSIDGVSMMPTSDLFGIVLAAMIASFAVSVLIVMTQGWHGRHSLDNDITGAQKFHEIPVPRVGGVALFVGILLVLSLGALYFEQDAQHVYINNSFKLLLAGTPAFFAGLTEDLTKKVSVISRLLATFASAVLACWLLGAYLPRVDVWGLDSLLHFVPLAIVFTAFAVAGVANSINIIDGFHGLAGSTVVIMLAGLAFLSWKLEDAFVLQLALMGIGATLGFLLVNYPTGKMFLGDGGAYFLGFWLAEVAVLLIIRNPGISTWQVLAICAYPVIETLYSIYRKKVIRRMSPGIPDCLHFHMLVHRRVVWQLFKNSPGRPYLRNAMVAPVISGGVVMTTLLAVCTGTTMTAAVTVVLFECWIYIVTYDRMLCRRWRLNPFPIWLGNRSKQATAG